MGSREEAKKLYNQALKIRADINQYSKQILEYLDFMDCKISKDLKFFSFIPLICGAQRNKFRVDMRFSKAFQAMGLVEKTTYYLNSLSYLINYIRQKENFLYQLENVQSQKKEIIQITILIYKGFRKWQETQLAVSYCQAKIQQTKLNLRNYLLRKSKNKDKISYILQSINNSHPQIVRFAFRNLQETEKWFPIIRQTMNLAHKLFIVEMASAKQKVGDRFFRLKDQEKKTKNKKLTNVQQQNMMALEHTRQKLKTNQSIVQEILKNPQSNSDRQQFDIFEQNNNQNVIKNSANQLHESFLKDLPKPNTITRKIYRNISKLMLPHYNFKTIEDLTNYQSISSNFETNHFIYRNYSKKTKFKMQLSIFLQPQDVIKALYNIELMKIWHQQVVQGQVKMLITAQNSAIIYQKNKHYSQWYKQRDFVFLRHVFQAENSYFMIDKSIQISHFMPFQSIVRANINYAVWKITKSASGSTIMLEIDIDHQGLLQSHQQELTLRYLQGFNKFEPYFLHFDNQNKLKQFFNLDWQIDWKLDDIQQAFEASNRLQSYDVDAVSVNTQDFKEGSEIQSEDFDNQQSFYTINGQSKSIVSKIKQVEKSKHEINEQDLLKSENLKKKVGEQQIKLNQNGQTILPNVYLKIKHTTGIFNEPNVLTLIKPQFENILLKDDWKHLQDVGGLKLIHQQKVQAQNNVFNFMLKTLKKNLLTGKGLSGVSLPVDVFKQDSYLQRCAAGFCLAPKFLEQAAKSHDKITRMKHVAAFCLSNILLTFDVQKAFNPILGQTYQGFIAGCPVYGQQISHHPPISSLYFIGRGYRIYGNQQPKGQLKMNSGTSFNEGFLIIQFDKKQKIYYHGPTWQISGLTMGQQKFNLRGKAQIIDFDNCLYSEIKFEEFKSFFSSNKWKYTDQMQGQIMKISHQFAAKILTAKLPKLPSPQVKQKIQVYSYIEGRWPLSLIIDKKQVYKINQDLPYELKDYIYPLNSNSNYRQDIVYRKLGNIARCQIQKDRLENLQRSDKKNRQKQTH